MNLMLQFSPRGEIIKKYCVNRIKHARFSPCSIYSYVTTMSQFHYKGDNSNLHHIFLK